MFCVLLWPLAASAQGLSESFPEAPVPAAELAERSAQALGRSGLWPAQAHQTFLGNRGDEFAVLGEDQTA